MIFQDLEFVEKDFIDKLIQKNEELQDKIVEMDNTIELLKGKLIEKEIDNDLMTLDEAIEHAKEVSRLGICSVRCAKQHEQLAIWLQELKNLKEIIR